MMCLFDKANSRTCDVTKLILYLQNIPTQQNTYDCGVFVLEVCSPCLFSHEIVTNKFFLNFF